MKKISQFIAESKANQIEPQENVMNYADSSDLKKYLEVCNKFIGDETKELVNWLIVNNSNYMQDLKVAKPKTDSIIADFYNAGPYKEPHKKEIYALIGKIKKSERLLEIPLLQTEEQFNGIITKKIAADEIIIDLESEKGRNAIAKKYAPLCHKIANGFRNKTNVEFSDILAAAYEGLTWAMNSYGKKSKKALKREQETGEETIDMTKYKATTFLTYASYLIRFTILETVKRDAHTVRIPTSEQSRERQEKGTNTKNRSVSGDKAVNGDERGKTLFDFVGGSETTTTDMERQDIDNTWKELLKRLKDSGKFSEKMIRCWMSFNQICGTEKKKNKDLAAELGISNSNVTYYCMCINNFIKKDPKVRKLALELQSLYAEAKQRSYDNDMDEPIYVKYSNDNDEENN